MILGAHTLVSQIIVQDGKISKINKRAGWNKAVQVGILAILLLLILVLAENFPSINKRAGWNKYLQVGMD